MKNHERCSAIPASMLAALLALSGTNAFAQDTHSIVGTYAAVTNEPFGNNPKGQLILAPDGHYSIILARAALPKIASGARDKATAEENKAVVGGSIGHYGKYTVDAKDKTITFNVEASTFPNWDGTSFKRAFKMSGDQLTYTNNAPSGGGGAIEVVWKRVK